MLSIQNLYVSVEGKEVLMGVNLEIAKGEVHAIMGKNGSGKTTLSYTLMGHPKYKVTQGDIFFEGKSILSLSANERAKLRMFLGFQYPVAIPGVTIAQFLRSAIASVRGEEVPTKEIRKLVKKEMLELDIPDSFMTRYLNDGFSGGEKKRLETLQMKLLAPKLMILDETDSGLDIDSMKKVAEGIQSSRAPERSILLITHYQRLLDYVKPDFVHVFLEGKIAHSGNADLALQLEKEGYEWVRGL